MFLIDKYHQDSSYLSICQIANISYTVMRLTESISTLPDEIFVKYITVLINQIIKNS